MIKNFFIPTWQNGYVPYSLRKTALTVYTLLLLILNLLFGVLSSTGPSEVSASSITGANLIAYANQERQANGLGQLTANSQLTAAAYAKANDMLQKDYWSHYGPNGETPWQFIVGAGYSYVHAGENLAKGFSTSEGVHQAWMASPTHRANILSGNYNDVGIAVVTGVLQGQETVLVVQMFGSVSDTSPAAPNPTPTEVPTQQQPLLEKGEIKSISISRPEQGSTLTDPTISVEGSVEPETSLEGSYTVEIYQDQIKIASTDSGVETWSVNGDGRWDDGEITIDAKIEDSPSIPASSVTFIVDTIPPVFDRDSAKVLFNPDTNIWGFKFIPLEESVTAALMVNDDASILEDMGDGFLGVEIDDSDVLSASSITLSLTDKHGNGEEFDVLGLFIKDNAEIQTTSIDLEEGSGSQYLGILSLIDKVDTRAKANFIFVGFIFVLLLVQVFQYHRLGMLDKKGGYLFTLGAWTFILLLLSSVGAVGELA